MVVIGSLINDGAAKNAKDLLAGTEGLELEEAELKRIHDAAPELAYYFDGKIVGSTFDTGTQKAIGAGVEFLDVILRASRSKVVNDEDGVLRLEGSSPRRTMP